ncbi:glycosyltransferase, partial [Nitrosopumilus sp.]|nr:glycosyltransferase [Nitrosopumilus sp.]
MNILVIHEIDWVNKVIFEPHHLSELFSKSGHNVFVIDCPDSENKTFTSGFKTKIIHNYSRVYDDASITLIHPPSILIKGLTRISHFLTCKKIIKKTILKNKIDIIFLYGSITNGIQTLQIAKELQIPVIFRLLDVAHGFVKIPILKNLAKKYESIVLSNSLKVLTTTPDMTRYSIEMGAKKGSVEYFPLGININNFKPLKKDVSFRDSLGISENDNVVIFVGTIYPFAGLMQIINNFENLKKENQNTKLIIVGGGPSYSQLKKFVIEKNLESDIILTNFIDQNEIPKYISLADICINPFEINYLTDRIVPTKIIEYLACGKPVLSTPLSGTKELLPDEKFGILYSNSDNFVNTLSTLLLDKNKL